MWTGIGALVVFLAVSALMWRAIRSRRFTRRALVGFVSAYVLFTLGLAAVTSVLLLTGTVTGRDKLRDWVVPFLAGKVRGGTLYIGHLSGSFVTNITIDSLAIRDTRNELLMSTGRATFAYDPRDLIDQRIFITSASVEHPYVHIIQHETGKWNFQEIFASEPDKGPVILKSVKTRSFGDYFVIDSTRVRDGTFLLTMPWHPDTALHGAVLDSVIRVHLAQPEKAVTKTFDGYGRNYAWTKGNLLLAHARLADPDSDKKVGQQFRVEGLSVDEYEPTFKFRNLTGDIQKLGDSVWFKVPRFEMPASLARGTGKVWWGSDLPIRVDIAIHGDSVSLDDVNWAYHDLPRTGGGTLDLLIKNDPDPKKLNIIDYKLVNMDVRSTKSHLTGAMSFGAGAPVLLIRDVNLRADPVDFDLLRTLNGKPFTQDWQGQLIGTVAGPGGPLTHFVVSDARGVFRDAHVPGAVSRFSAKGELDILFPAFTAFHGFDVDVGSLDLRTIEYLFPVFPRLGGVAMGTATLDSSWLDVRFSNAHIALQDGDGDPSRFSGSGRITYGDLMSYDVALQAEPISLTMIARSYPNPLRGLFSGPIRAKGTSPDLELSMSLQGPNGALSFDGRVDLDSIGGMGAHGRGEFSAITPAGLLENSKIPVGAFSGHYDIDLAGETAASLKGTAAVDIEKTEFDSVRVYPSFAHLTFDDGRMMLIDSAYVKTAAFTLVARGGLGLPQGKADSLRFSVSLDSLGGLRRYAHPDTSRLGAALTPADSISGSLSLAGVAIGRFDSVNVSGHLNGSSLYFNRERGDRLRADFSLSDVHDALSGSLDARVDTVTLGGVRLDTIGASIRLDDLTHAGFTLSAQSHNGPTAAVHGIWSKTEPADSAKADSRLAALARMTGKPALATTTGNSVQTILIDSIGLTVADAAWRLAGPATITLDSAGSRIDSLVLRNKDVAVLALSGNIPNAGAAAARIDASGIPLRDVGILAQLSDTVSGTAQLTSSVTGTRDRPHLVAQAALASVKYQGVDMDRIVANAQYDSARLHFDMDVVRSGQHALTGRVSLPLELTLPLAMRWRKDTISGLIKADSTDLSLLQTVLGTSTVRNMTGRLVANVGISGTASVPVLSGSADVYNGSALIVPAGVTFHDINAHLIGGRDALGHDSITINELTALTGGTKSDPVIGRANITGTLKAIMESSGEPSFAIALGLDKFHAYNKRSNAEVWVSTPGDSIRLRGSIASSNLTGALSVDHGSIFLADPEIARKQAVQFGLAGDSIGAASHTVSATMQRFLTNLQIQPPLPVTLGGDVRLRSKDANVKLVGDLQIQKSTQTTARTVAASGELVPGLDLVGTLRTESGTYNLNLAVVQREFQVVPGGTVAFDGPPQDPTLNIDAVYDVRQVRDFQVKVNLNGRLLPFPVIDFKSNQSYTISPSDLVSYLLIGAPGFDFGASAGTQQILSSVLAPTLSAVAAAGLRTALGGWVDAFQLQLGSSGAATGSDAVKQSLQGATIGAEKQFGNNIYLRANTGFCQFAQTGQANPNPLAGLGAQAEYRFDAKLSLKLAYDPPTANRNCTQAALIGLAPTPSNFSFSFAHAWRF